MQEMIITEKEIKDYTNYLVNQEKSEATVRKYEREVRKLKAYADGRELSKELMISYKNALRECGKYKIESVNSIIESANRFLAYKEWYSLRVNIYPIQKKRFQDENRQIRKEEYDKLLRTALRLGKKRLYHVLISLSSTGIRISELEFITVEAVKTGVAVVYNKGKSRFVIFTEDLCRQLLRYIREEGIISGSVFISRNGNPLNRSNVWKEMKTLAKAAGVLATKVFPHNMRKLFATCLYKQENDIAKVADILGHSNLNTTRIYLRETYDQCRSALEKLGLAKEPVLEV